MFVYSQYYENNDEHIGRNRWVDYAQVKRYRT